MSNIIETLNRNEVLDAEWYCKILGVDINKLSVRDILGITGDLPSIGQMLFGKYRLVLIYSKRQDSLADSMHSDEQMQDYIVNHTEEAFVGAIKQYAPYIYILNIVSVESFRVFELTNDKKLLDKQLSTFIPIIQMFMVKALTDTLNISSNR